MIKFLKDLPAGSSFRFAIGSDRHQWFKKVRYSVVYSGWLCVRLTDSTPVNSPNGVLPDNTLVVTYPE